MSVVTERFMVCDVESCGWRIPEDGWEFHRSLRFAADSGSWWHDGDDSLCPLHTAETFADRQAAAAGVHVPSADELADWCHP